MKSNYNKYLIDDESSLDNELLFDDWNVRDSAFYSRERKTYILLFLLFSVCTIFATIVSIFYIYVLFFLVLFSISLFCILFQFLRIQNRHIQIYKDVIVVTNIFRKKELSNIVSIKHLCWLNTLFSLGLMVYIWFLLKMGRLYVSIKIL